MRSSELVLINTHGTQVLDTWVFNRDDPRDLPREDDAVRGVRTVLIDAARTTRKYGLGWLCISQTLSYVILN